MNAKSLAAVYFLICASFVYGADGGTVQRISWEQVEGVFLYEVRVEQRGADGTWKEQLVQMVENEAFLDCELPPGKYRFSVRSFDILKRPGSVSEWAEFSVDNGKKTHRLQKDAAVDKANDSKEAGSPTDTGQTAGTETGGQKIVYAADTFNNDTIRKKPLRLELLWTPIVPLPTGTYNKIFESAMFQAAGFAPRFTVLPLRLRVLQAGLELMPSWNFLHGAEENWAQYSHIFGANGALVFQLLILRNTALSIRAGGGMSFFYSQFKLNLNTEFEESTSHLKWNPFAYGGLEFNCFLGPSFVLSIGAEYVHIFAKNDMMLMYIRPIFGMGVWF